jgi:hypothetical protein
MPMRDDQFTPMPTLEQAAALESLGHQVQSAIAFLMSHTASNGQRHPETEPKHLRVGVNSAMVETAALGRLLLAKGIFTNTEYFEMLIKVWVEERDSYLQQLHAIDPRLSL